VVFVYQAGPHVETITLTLQRERVADLAELEARAMSKIDPGLADLIREYDSGPTMIVIGGTLVDQGEARLALAARPPGS
jgi:hypothetical protein